MMLVSSQLGPIQGHHMPQANTQPLSYTPQSFVVRNVPSLSKLLYIPFHKRLMSSFKCFSLSIEIMQFHYPAIWYILSIYLLVAEFHLIMVLDHLNLLRMWVAKIQLRIFLYLCSCSLIDCNLLLIIRLVAIRIMLSS